MRGGGVGGVGGAARSVRAERGGGGWASACFAAPLPLAMLIPCAVPPHPPFPYCSLEYIKEAVAEADPVTGFAGLIKQRRRWLNGTFFAMIYSLSNWSRIWTESHHTCVRSGGGGGGLDSEWGGGLACSNRGRRSGPAAASTALANPVPSGPIPAAASGASAC